MPRTYSRKTDNLVTFEDGLREAIDTLDNRKSRLRASKLFQCLACWCHM